MKSIIFTIIFITHFIYIFSEPIDSNTAKIVAKNFIDRKRISNNEVLNVVIEKTNGNTSFYVINFKDGGWVMVSSDNNTVPVLGYSLFGTYKIEDPKPEAFLDWINGYKKQITYASKLKTKSPAILEKWEKLLHKSKTKSTLTYTPGTPLLDVPNRGHVQWSQDRNNDGGCVPSYHKYCPSGTGEYCFCNKKSVGCGAVAMGQIMWYWQWPYSSSYRTYNWSSMPAELKNSSSTNEEDEIAHLLRDCGSASNMTYWCSGSWTTMNNIVDAFKNSFNYKGVKKQVRSKWSYGNAWEDLLRSEIDAGRPILYRGDKCDLCSEKHYFVLDGYDANDPDYFWFNFGWGYPGYSYNISRQYLGDLTPGESNFNKNQMAITGISPTYDENIPTNISDVPYTSISNTKIVQAQQNISLPMSGKTLSVENGGNLTFIAENSITINPGFYVKLGGNFSLKNEAPTPIEMDIKVPTWYNAFTPNGDGINDVFCIDVENANSWEFEAFDINGRAIFQSAGTITGDKACMWDGSGANCMEAYTCIIRFKNNYGRAVENAYTVTVICGSKSSHPNTDNLLLRDLENGK